MQLAENTQKNNKINIIIPNMSPADIRELKRVLQAMKVDYVLCPDFSETLDRPFSRLILRWVRAAQKIEDIKQMGGAAA